jgi:hypothetical protein
MILGYRRSLGLGPHAVVVSPLFVEDVSYCFLSFARVNDDHGTAFFHILRKMVRIVLGQSQGNEGPGEGADGGPKGCPTQNSGQQSTGQNRPGTRNHRHRSQAGNRSDTAADGSAGNGPIASLLLHFHLGRLRGILDPFPRRQADLVVVEAGTTQGLDRIQCMPLVLEDTQNRRRLDDCHDSLPSTRNEGSHAQAETFP